MVRAKLDDGTFTSSLKRIFPGDALFLSLRRTRRPRTPGQKRVRWRETLKLQTYHMPATFDDGEHMLTYRPANESDLSAIVEFVDFWLSGGAKKLGLPGAGADCFVPHGQQQAYIKYKVIYICEDADKLIGWAVKSKSQTLIHLLVHPDYRGKAVGTNLLKIIDPQLVRSKSDQSTGNPLPFYLKHGYKIVHKSQGKHKNIDILEK